MKGQQMEEVRCKTFCAHATIQKSHPYHQLIDSQCRLLRGRSDEGERLPENIPGWICILI